MFVSNKQYQTTTKKSGFRNQGYTDWLDEYMMNTFDPGRRHHGYPIPEEDDPEA